MKPRLFPLFCEEPEMSVRLFHSPQQPKPRLKPLLHPTSLKDLFVAGPAWTGDDAPFPEGSS